MIRRFNPRARTERDTPVADVEQPTAVQSMRRTGRAGDQRVLQTRNPGFNPRAHTGHDRLGHVGGVVDELVSIHAPQGGATDRRLG